ncbi:hypothetical protein Tco_0879948, partial [Tanacetum coccineum]
CSYNNCQGSGMHVLFYKSCEGRNIVAHLLNKLILAEGSTYFQHVDDHTNTKVITSPVNFGVIVSKYSNACLAIHVVGYDDSWGKKRIHAWCDRVFYRDNLFGFA